MAGHSVRTRGGGDPRAIAPTLGDHCRAYAYVTTPPSLQRRNWNQLSERAAGRSCGRFLGAHFRARADGKIVSARLRGGGSGGSATCSPSDANPNQVGTLLATAPRLMSGKWLRPAAGPLCNATAPTGKNKRTADRYWVIGSCKGRMNSRKNTTT